MTKNGDEQALNRCLMIIEQKLGWGSSDRWANYDFEKLSEEINTVTNVRLSLTTLKRIWGKLKYDSAPTLTTLNTLARFAGYDDWRTFRQTESGILEETELDEPAPAAITAQKSPKLKSAHYRFLLLIPVFLLGYTLIPGIRNKGFENVDRNLFTFRADKIKTEGVPNSVVFHYNAKAAKTDSVFIVQTWDMSRKKRVSRNDTDHSAIYYYPGYFRTKLVVDQQLVKEHDLWITSGGWLCLAEQAPVPVYFTKDECVKDGIVAVDKHILDKYNLSLHPKAPRIRIFNQRDMGNVMSDNFTFETYVKNDFGQGANACQPMQVLIQCKNDVIIIPLAAKECVGDLSLTFCGEFASSKNADLSGFGADLTQWTKLRVESVNKKAVIYVNDAKAYTFDFKNEATGIVGVQYRFNGTGAVKGTWFEGNGKKLNF
jgi:hypothetical protein